MGVMACRTYSFVAHPAIKSEPIARAIVVAALALLILLSPPVSLFRVCRALFDMTYASPHTRVYKSYRLTHVNDHSEIKRAATANDLLTINYRQVIGGSPQILVVLVRVFFTCMSSLNTYL